MNARNQIRAWVHQQHGAALMLMLLIIILGLSSALLSPFRSSKFKIEQDKKTVAVLAQAKEALIGYAVTYAYTHTGQVSGYLPCPDIDGSNGEGSSKLSCGSKNISALGRLPWRTLDLAPLKDGSYECLWYAVSGTYKGNPKTDLMNWDNLGLLSVSYSNRDNISDVVAVIFAPGVPLTNQNRSAAGSTQSCGGNYTPANYLDSDGVHDNALISNSANTYSNFFAGPSAQINDQLVYITRADIFNALAIRTDFIAQLSDMTLKTAECLAYFATQNTNYPSNKSLPWPAPMVLPNYTSNTSYNDASGLHAGRVPYQVDSSKSTILNNTITGNKLLSTSNCPAGWSNIYPWWRNWKDHMFYAIGKDFQPSSLNTKLPCTSCLKVNSLGSYAAVVIFAGQALTTQNRSDKKSILSAYLEGRNTNNQSNIAGNSNYEGAPSSNTFNDMTFCIKEDLSVVKYDPAQGRCP